VSDRYQRNYRDEQRLRSADIKINPFILDTKKERDWTSTTLSCADAYSHVLAAVSVCACWFVPIPVSLTRPLTRSEAHWCSHGEPWLCSFCNKVSQWLLLLDYLGSHASRISATLRVVLLCDDVTTLSGNVSSLYVNLSLILNHTVLSNARELSVRSLHNCL
jgi:hypothetical protein